MKIKCIIVDDEPLAIEVIESHIQKFDDFDRIFETEILDKKKREVKITTTGSVKDEKVGKSRIR